MKSPTWVGPAAGAASALARELPNAIPPIAAATRAAAETARAMLFLETVISCLPGWPRGPSRPPPPCRSPWPRPDQLRYTVYHNEGLPVDAIISEDARVVRTREALRQAMTDLASEAPLEAITIRAVAARAGVGYATFFRHYADKEALLADVADQLTRAFLEQVRPLLRQKDRLAAARSLCAFVEDHLPIHRALIAGGAGDTVRAEMLRQTLATVAQARGRVPESALDELVLFHVVSSILNLLAWWLRNLDRVDAEAMGEIIERTVLTPVGALQRQPPAGLEPGGPAS
ncbi:MAG: TetR/AcrR family transcriptional regulator [Phenylobacterium sp.]|nr:MAG: TetR/AcrR family transcriptional regulator [Phenylobacterium sp.]